MFHLHGWAEVLTTTTGEEDSLELETIAESLRARVIDLGLNDRARVWALGGSYILQISLVQNRDRGDLRRCQTLLEELGQLAPGSYGVFYVRDGSPGDFSRLVVRRGRVETVNDDLFTPVVPTIEDE